MGPLLEPKDRDARRRSPPAVAGHRAGPGQRFNRTRGVTLRWPERRHPHGSPRRPRPLIRPKPRN